MKSETATFRARVTPRVILSALGILIALTALAAFLHASQVLPLETIWPAVGRAIGPLGEWRQISALLLVALGIVVQFMLPEKLPDRLSIRKGVEEADTRSTEKRQTSWMLVLSAIFVAVWVGILELPSRGAFVSREWGAHPDGSGRDPIRGHLLASSLCRETTETAQRERRGQGTDAMSPRRAGAPESRRGIPSGPWHIGSLDGLVPCHLQCVAADHWLAARGRRSRLAARRDETDGERSTGHHSFRDPRGVWLGAGTAAAPLLDRSNGPGRISVDGSGIPVSHALPYDQGQTNLRSVDQTSAARIIARSKRGTCRHRTAGRPAAGQRSPPSSCQE